jgi:adenylosuccinate synthase
VDRLAGLGPLRLGESYHDPQRGQTLRELPPVGPELAARTALSLRLMELGPGYRHLPGWEASGLVPEARSYVEQVAELLGTKIAAASLGPTAEDKQVLDPAAPL